jgi:hypothetical protein
MGINADILAIKEKKPDRGRFCRGSFTDIIDNHRQIIKTRPYRDGKMWETAPKSN